ncbi:hypothetical protein E2C01_084736 [Portunus trituberculatus]|uniref:Uncharacterized protein n=1 Tax=Portunus trituberculatus TaxID=210409 RepID=A0A5B7J710_PORTR|nr:hypothetical protein [Portunus trituberculatus]
MVTSRGGEARARRGVRRGVPHGGTPLPGGGGRDGAGCGREGGRDAAAGAGVSCTHQHNTNQFGSSHTAGQEASPKCTAAPPSPLYRHDTVSNGVYRSGGRGEGLACGGRRSAGPPRPAAASLASTASRPGPGLRGAARGCPGRGAGEGHVQPTSKSNLTKRVTKGE